MHTLISRSRPHPCQLYATFFNICVFVILLAEVFFQSRFIEACPVTPACIVVINACENELVDGRQRCRPCA